MYTANRTGVTVTAYEKRRKQESKLNKKNIENDQNDQQEESWNSSKFLSNINTK